MKNVIPLIVAVVLALAAVFLVSRVMVQTDTESKEPQVSVVIAARDLERGEELTPGSCSFKSIPRSALPKSALLWDNVGLAYGQKLPYKIPEGDYIQLSDLQLNVMLSDCVEKGKWLIPVTFTDPVLVIFQVLIAFFSLNPRNSKGSSLEEMSNIDFCSFDISFASFS